ncbi:MAG: hypothetical protein MJ217_01755 [Bacilli bacterium]|nr:hypothetical protein [Bacilli bacterium]
MSLKEKIIRNRETIIASSWFVFTLIISSLIITIVYVATRRNEDDSKNYDEETKVVNSIFLDITNEAYATYADINNLDSSELVINDMLSFTYYDESINISYAINDHSYILDLKLYFNDATNLDNALNELVKNKDDYSELVWNYELSVNPIISSGISDTLLKDSSGIKGLINNNKDLYIYNISRNKDNNLVSYGTFLANDNSYYSFNNIKIERNEIDFDINHNKKGITNIVKNQNPLPFEFVTTYILRK